MRRKVLIIKRTLGGGGAEKLLVDTLRLLDYSRYDVTLLTCDTKGVYYPQIDPRTRIKVFRDIFSSFVLRNLFYHIPPLRRFIMALNWKRARKAIRNEAFDIAVSYLEGHSACTHLGLLDVARRNLTWVHIDLFENPWPRKYYASPQDERDFYRKVDEIVFVSGRAQSQFDKYIPVHAKTRVLYNMIDSERILALSQENSITSGKPLLVAVGRLMPQKRFDRLLRAMSIIRQKNQEAELWILGQGDMKPELERLSKELHLQDSVRFLGFVPNPYPYVKAADVFVLSSDTEGYPLVVAEAMCLGKAIVSTAVTGPTEMLSGNTGVLVPLDEQALADACLQLLADDGAREQLGKRAREEAKRKFDVSAYLSAFYAVLDGEEGV